MKAILEFNLPEDENEFKLASRGRDFYIDLYDIQQKIRSFDKHGMGIDVPSEEDFSPEEFKEWAKQISRLIEEIRSISYNSTEGID